MNLRPSVAALLTTVVLAIAAFAQTQQSISDPKTREICASVAALQLPAEDGPTAAEQARLAGCASVDLYFGFGRPADPIKARKCAYAEIASGDEPVLGGRTLLMTAYANGRGARRDFDLALKLACEIPGAPQDVAGRVRELAQLKAGGYTGDSFSICTHSTGTALYQQCAELQERFDSIERERDLAGILAGWHESDRKAFAEFRAVANRFFHAHTRNEVNLRSTVEVHEWAFLENELIASLRRFDAGEVPRFSAADSAESLAAMRAAYAATQQDPDRTWGTATTGGIKGTQELWAAYRDAWLRFAAIRYPSVKAASWETWLARQRTVSLNRFLLAASVPRSDR